MFVAGVGCASALCSKKSLDAFWNLLIHSNNSNTIDTLSHYPDEFEKLWFAYPANRRNDWDEAFRIYQQALRHGATLEIIMTALEAAKSSIAWTKDGGQYIPGISKWLQREPWREANLQKAQKENQEQWNSQ